MQRAAGIGVPRRKELRDGGYIAHETRNIRKGGTAEPLENIAFSGVGDDEEGEVDMSLAVSLAENGASVQPEAIQNLFHKQSSFEMVNELQMFFQQQFWQISSSLPQLMILS